MEYDWGRMRACRSMLIVGREVTTLSVKTASDAIQALEQQHCHMEILPNYRMALRRNQLHTSATSALAFEVGSRS